MHIKNLGHTSTAVVENYWQKSFHTSEYYGESYVKTTTCHPRARILYNLLKKELGFDVIYKKTKTLVDVI